jgi:septal ring factor EnvC (AmiA/AmiB activator)
MSPTDIAVLVAALAGSGGIAALLNSRSQRRMTHAQVGLVSIEAAEKVVLLQSRSIENLEDDVAEAFRRARHAEETAQACRRELDSLRDDLVETRRQRDSFAVENERLRAKVAELEARVEELERHDSGR